MKHQIRSAMINFEEEMERYNQWLEAKEEGECYEILHAPTEKDPHGRDPHAGGAKVDAGKPEVSLLLMFGKALTAVAEVGTHGAIKYTRDGWETVPDGINRYTDAMLRHLFKEHYEDYDSDIPVRHIAQTAWNALARLELTLRKEARE